MDWEVPIVVGITVTLLLAITGCITGYNMQQQAKQAEMVLHGADPLAVRCVFASSQDPICIAFAARRAP
jgi:hypothetical protein